MEYPKNSEHTLSYNDVQEPYLAHVNTMPSRGILTLLAVSATLLALAPFFMPESYSWIAHTTSESGAQGIPFAWIARTGFLAFGLAVCLLVAGSGSQWHQVTKISHCIFGLCMLLVAAGSSKPWQDSLPFDLREDFIYSIAASLMGVAFTIGVFSRALTRNSPFKKMGGTLDLLALFVAILIPLGMVSFSTVDGLLQRSMFLVAYAWYGAETVRLALLRTEVKKEILSMASPLSRL